MIEELNKRLLSVAEYHKMAEVGILSHQDKIELILGEIFYRSPIGSKHQAVIDRLTHLFSRLFSDQAILRIQGPIQLGNILNQSQMYYYLSKGKTSTPANIQRLRMSFY